MKLTDEKTFLILRLLELKQVVASVQVEETAADDTEICALPYIVALHAFCTVDPTLCAPPSDPARFAVTLQPYLKTQVCMLQWWMIKIRFVVHIDEKKWLLSFASA